MGEGKETPQSPQFADPEGIPRRPSGDQEFSATHCKGPDGKDRGAKHQNRSFGYVRRVFGVHYSI